MKSTTRFSPSPSEVLLWAALLYIGAYHEYVACLFSVALFGVLLWKAKKNGGIKWRFDPVSIPVFVLVVFLFFTPFWAVDAGTAFVGALKFLPLLLYECLLWQENRRTEILDRLPWAAGGLVILSLILMWIPPVASFFTVRGRMAGIFQYPNAFAAFLLLAQVLLVTRGKFNWQKALLLAVLVGGMVYTGSRATFVLALFIHFLVFLTGPGKKRKWIAVLSLAAVVTGLFLYARFSGAENAVTRLFSLSFMESSLLGRILYVFDALPQILRRPFGMGYLGWNYIQHAIQTGVYTVRFVHSDPVQILLDVGWIPFGLFIWTVVVFFRSRKVARGEKLAALALLLHASFDFDLQFLSLCFVLLVLMPPREGKTKMILKKLSPRRALAGALALGCLYMGTALFFARFHQAPFAQELYPWYTPNEEYYLSRQTDVRRAREIADHILERNANCKIAYSAKVRAAYAEGKLGEVIRIKNKLFEVAPFSYEEYEEYARLLLQGVSLYQRQGDAESVDYCRKELFAIPDRLARLKDRQSALGKLIQDQPVTTLPEEILAQIEVQRRLAGNEPG